MEIDLSKNTPEDQKIILAALQKLTNNILSIDERGFVTIVDVTIDSYQNKPTGTELLYSLIAFLKVIEINLTNNPSGDDVCQSFSPDNKNGVGSRCIIYWTNTDSDLPIYIPGVGIRNSMGSLTPSFIILGHELIHAYHAVFESSNYVKSVPYYITLSDGTKWVTSNNPEEILTVFGMSNPPLWNHMNGCNFNISENSLRRENGLLERGIY